MPIDDESLAEDVERMEQRRRDSLAFIRQRDAARVAGGEPIAGSAAADRHDLLAEVARLAEEVERLRGRVACVREAVTPDGCCLSYSPRTASWWVGNSNGDGGYHPTLDAAWTALDAARKEGGK